jgi:hypothetical protein
MINMNKIDIPNNFLIKTILFIIIFSLINSSASGSLSNLKNNSRGIDEVNTNSNGGFFDGPGLSAPMVPETQLDLFDALIFGDFSTGGYRDQNQIIDELEIVESYKAFFHVKIDNEQYENLKNQGVLVQKLNNLHTLKFGQKSYNTFENKDGLSHLFNPEWQANSDENYYIIQFKGPIKNEWLKACQDAGARLLNSPINYYAHLINIQPENINNIENLEFVSWLDAYHPQLRLRGGLELDMDKLASSKESVNVEIIFFKTITLNEFYERMADITEIGGIINQLELNNNWWYSAKVSVQKSQLVRLAELSGVNYIHPYGQRQLRNDNANWVIQSFDTAGKDTPVWDAGIHGEGIVLGMADTGIDFDHIMFRHNATDTGTPGPNHRKVIRYNTKWDDWDYNGNVDSGHGTHTSASLAGDDLTTPGGYDTNDGMAYAAKIAFYDIVKTGNSWDTQIISVYFDDAYAVGARTHSDSWGDDVLTYSPRAQRCDQYQWDHYDFLIFIAPGNNGKILEPATAKNVVGVGNAVNGNSKGLAGGSGKGPTLEGMISPTIVAPGSSITSANSDGTKGSLNSGFRAMGGTSMATPVAAGAAGLVEQYFKDGFYPTGIKNPGNSFMPSGPLKKAVLVNSGWDMYGGSNINAPIPDNSQGWGKIKLDDALYFKGDTRELWCDDRYNQTDGKAGLKTGDYEEYILNVNDTEPFEVTMVWNDYPGAGLKNDLDLIVTAPDGNKYLGNVYKNGESVTGGSSDINNPIESVYFKTPKSGYYQIKIVGTNIAAGGEQNYSIVATGEINTDGKGAVSFNATKYGRDAICGIFVMDSNLAGAGTTQVTIESSVETSPETVTLTESSKVKGKFTGGIKLSSGTPSSDGLLQVAETDTIKSTYTDNQPTFISTADALVDMKPPEISGHQIIKTDTDSFIVYFRTDEPSTSEVRYGTSIFALHNTVKSQELRSKHILEVTGLKPETSYFYEISSTDDLQNLKIENQNGDYYNVITASFEIVPDKYKVGWATENENYNHFDDGMIYAGIHNDTERLGAVQFDLTAIPDETKIFKANLYVYGDTGTFISSTGGNWNFEFLNKTIDPLFNGSKYSPVFSQIQNTAPVGSLDPSPYVISPSEGIEDIWGCLNFNYNHRSELEDRISGNGKITVRISGPSPSGIISGMFNLFRWDSGYNTANGSRGQFYRPHFVIWAEKAPRIDTNAPTSISFDEDNFDSEQINLSDIFVSNLPLNYSVEGQYAENGTDLLEANISVEILPLGNVKFTPQDDWNGIEKVVFNASIIDTSAGDPDYIKNLGYTFILYELDVEVLPVNDLPKIVSINGTPVYNMMEFSLGEGRLFSTEMEILDVDLQYEGDTHRFISNSTLITFESDDSNKIEFLPTTDDIGEHFVKFQVRDSGEEKDEIQTRFIIKNINDPPVPIITAPSNYSYHNTSWPVNFNGSESYDPDIRFGDRITFQWLSDKEGLLSTESTFEKYIQTVGQHKITLKISDSGTLFNAVAVTIYVNKTEGFKIDDIDHDDMPNDWEILFGLNPYDSIDRNEDPDGDLLSNYEEYIFNTYPFEPDTDADGFNDGEEIERGTNPTDSKSYPGKSVSEGESLIVIILIIFAVAIIALISFLLLRHRSMREDLEDIQIKSVKEERIEVEEISEEDSIKTIKKSGEEQESLTKRPERLKLKGKEPER